jgi:hypothetical protein
MRRIIGWRIAYWWWRVTHPRIVREIEELTNRLDKTYLFGNNLPLLMRFLEHHIEHRIEHVEEYRWKVLERKPITLEKLLNEQTMQGQQGYKIGDEVLCNVEEELVEGVIDRTGHNEEEIGYRVNLVDGRMYWLREDQIINGI